ncbi:MAG TPA: MarR family transcriptional regulator [Candidatus Elarobacter sp.]
MHAVGLFLDARLGGEISQPEALVIVHLARGPSTINAVHRAFLHRRSTLTSVLDRLESKGLVRRSSAPGDRRSVRLELTARGTRAATAIAHAFEELRRDIDASPPISARDVARVRAVAEKASAAQQR